KALRNSRLLSQNDHLHLCIMCLRAIMNYQSGFNQVMSHPNCVNEITLSLNNNNHRTKALVLELLAAVCFVQGGHEIILAAFNNFKEVCAEKSRFEKLMAYFCSEERSMDFMVACMQFINIVVHSVENMNFRVHLQYEFTQLGLDDYLETLKESENERLQVQVQAYLDNLFDVGVLLEDAEAKNTLLEHLEEVQQSNTELSSRLQECENEAMEKVSDLEKQLINTTKEMDVLKELDMDAFEELFKTKAQTPPSSVSTLKMKVARKSSSKISLLEPNRAKNLAITLHKGGMDSKKICAAIETYNLKELSLDFLEQLEHFIPSDHELKLIQNYEHDGRSVQELSEEDRFMAQFGKIPRLGQRISTLTFMGNFRERVQLLQPQLNAIIAASMSIKSSNKVKKILEIILAFGNYMNSGKRGAAYGFRLQSLDQLLDTKSTDRKQTLLHFLVSTIQEKFPLLHTFHTELQFMDKAAMVSLDSILLDVRALEAGMEVARKEFEEQKDNAILRDFLSDNSSLLDSVVKDAKTAQEVYEAVVEYFGENPATTPPSMFFLMFIRFIKAYKMAELENEQRKRESFIGGDERKEPAMTDAGKMGGKVPMAPTLAQVDLIAELKRRQVSPLVREGKDGTIEDIIT
ncbi:formin-like protein 1, partial [Clarias magur]